MAGYVIQFNRLTRERRVREFTGATGPREAMAYRLELESQRTDENVEIAALTSRSLGTLERTHSRYFTGRELTTI
jgi:hypothetical protein